MAACHFTEKMENMLVSGDYYGLPTCSISNTHLRLEFLAKAGPRLVRLFLGESRENQLAEAPNFSMDTPYGVYHFYGGHRLWHGPEAFPRSYIPDDSGLTVEELADGVRLTQPAEAPTGIAKSIDVYLDPSRAALKLVHTLRNDGLWAVELTPWGITQLPLGGLAVLPMPGNPPKQSALLPDRNLALWHFTHWTDPRLSFQDDYLLIQAQPLMPPCKIGFLSRAGWIGYLRQGVFFRKSFEPEPQATHTDLSCNVEIFCNDELIELETLAPLRRLEPGSTVSQTEWWEFTTGVDVPMTLEGVRSLANTLNLSQ